MGDRTINSVGPPTQFDNDSFHQHDTFDEHNTPDFAYFSTRLCTLPYHLANPTLHKDEIDEMTRSCRSTTPEDTLVTDAGLHLKTIKGDGNCLFNAFSDQLYGHQGEHRYLRDETIQHMRDNAHVYSQFVAVNEEVRRQPKRKNKAACSVDAALPTQADIERQFEQRLNNMQRTGVWGDNLEIAAFCTTFGVRVRVWQTEYAYPWYPRTDTVRAAGDELPKNLDELPELNIFFHDWQHYSSVRNPHTPQDEPAVELRSTNASATDEATSTRSSTPESTSTTDTSATSDTTVDSSDHATFSTTSSFATTEKAPSRGLCKTSSERMTKMKAMKAVKDALPFETPWATIAHALDHTDCSVGRALSLLSANHQRTSSPSASSSSIERDDDESDQTREKRPKLKLRMSKDPKVTPTAQKSKGLQQSKALEMKKAVNEEKEERPLKIKISFKSKSRA